MNHVPRFSIRANFSGRHIYSFRCTRVLLIYILPVGGFSQNMLTIHSGSLKAYDVEQKTAPTLLVSVSFMPRHAKHRILRKFVKKKNPTVFQDTNTARVAEWIDTVCLILTI